MDGPTEGDHLADTGPRVLVHAGHDKTASVHLGPVVPGAPGEKEKIGLDGQVRGDVKIPFL